MISSKLVTAVCLGAAICTAQTISISGTVVDTADVGISGATVKLEEAAISASTAADGTFSLTGSLTSTHPVVKTRTLAAHPIQLRAGEISFTLSENAPVAISMHDVAGRPVFSSRRTHGPGTHTLNVPVQSTGVFICKVTIGNEASSFKATAFGNSSTERAAGHGEPSALAKQAKSAVVIADVIFVAKEGQLDYRVSIMTSDTSGIVIRMIPNAGNVTDADGNVYQSVRLGNFAWTVENLKTARYNDGTPILHVPDSAAWHNLFATSSTTAAYCYYDSNAASMSKYGALYNWFAVNTGKLAPEGWRVPTDADWDSLENYLIANGYNWDGTTSGNKITKSMAARTDWCSSGDTGAIGNDLSRNNTSGLSALPGGFRSYYGGFALQGRFGGWWSATEFPPLGAYCRYLRCYDVYLRRIDYVRQDGYSVRLVRDYN